MGHYYFGIIIHTCAVTSNNISLCALLLSEALLHLMYALVLCRIIEDHRGMKCTAIFMQTNRRSIACEFLHCFRMNTCRCTMMCILTVEKGSTGRQVDGQRHVSVYTTLNQTLCMWKHPTLSSRSLCTASVWPYAISLSPTCTVYVSGDVFTSAASQRDWIGRSAKAKLSVHALPAARAGVS